MKLKKRKSITVGCYKFKIKWDKTHSGGSFSFRDQIINIGIKGNDDQQILMIICHELMEICAVEMNVRMQRPDINDDYIFVYDHRQHETMMSMFSGLLAKFLH